MDRPLFFFAIDDPIDLWPFLCFFVRALARHVPAQLKRCLVDLAQRSISLAAFLRWEESPSKGKVLGRFDEDWLFFSSPEFWFALGNERGSVDDQKKKKRDSVHLSISPTSATLFFPLSTPGGWECQVALLCPRAGTEGATEARSNRPSIVLFFLILLDLNASPAAFPPFQKKKL